MSDRVRQAAEKMDVAYVARLAHLRLTEKERRRFQEQLDRIVAYVRKIGELDLSGIEPTAHGHPLVNVFREDRSRPSGEAAAARENAPARKGGQFLVPRIVE